MADEGSEPTTGQGEGLSSREGGLARRLRSSHMRVALIAVVFMAVLLANSVWLSQIAVHQSSLRAPSVEYSLQASAALQKTEAALGGWLEDRDEEFNRLRRRTWKEDLFPKLLDLRLCLIELGEPASLDLLDEATRELEAVRILQWWVEDLSRMPGSRTAVDLLARQVSPVALAIEAALVQVGRSAGVRTLVPVVLAQRDFSRAQRQLERYVRFGGGEVGIAAFETSLELVEENVARFEAGAEPLATAIVTLRRDLPAYRRIASEIIELVDRGHQDLVRVVFDTRLRPRSASAVRSVEKIAEMAVDGMHRESRHVRNYSIGSIVLSALSLVLLWFFAGRWSALSAGRIVQPITHLQRAAADLAAGRLDTDLEVHQQDEVGALTRAFNIMRRQIDASRAELEDSAALHREVINGAVEGMISINENGIVLSFNRAAAEIFGHEPEEVIGRNVSMLMPSPDRERHDGYLAEYRKTGVGKIIGIGRDVMGLRKDGLVFPMGLSISDVRLRDHRIFAGITRDLTEQKAREQEIEEARNAAEEQARAERLLHRATQMAAETDSFEEALQHVIDVVCQLTRWPVGHAYLPSAHDPGELLPSTIWHLDDPDTYRVFREITERTSFSTGEGLPGRILEVGEPAWISNVQTDRNFPRNQIAGDLGVKSAFGFPVEVRGEIIAVLEFFSRDEILRDENLMQLIGNITKQLGRVFERKRAAEQLMKAREAAEAANRAKSTFLANMSHELRTPITIIIGYSEILEEDAEACGQEDLLPDLRKIGSASRHLLEVINSILDLSKIEAGKMDVFLETFEIAPFVAEIAETVAPMVESSENTLQVDCGDGLGSIRADRTKLRQSLFNLLSNAAKFTSFGRIGISVEREATAKGDWIYFTVTDTGIGIPADKIETLFDEFTQADESTTRDFGGTGLGLAVSRRFCRLMGGEIEAESTVDEGSTFRIRLPAVVDLPSEVVDDASGDSRPSDRPALAGSAQTVLVIDDDSDTRDLIKRSLVNEGFDVAVASNGEEGLCLARELHPLAITLDVIMPSMDGWALLRALKADPELQDIPVIMVTMVEDRSMGYALGAAEYLTKPLDRKRLSQVLNRLSRAERSHTVLIVDDDPEARAIARRLLERERWGVAEAENGRVALDRIAESPPGLILLDLMMPVMDGFEFVSEMQKVEAWRQIPVVVLTAKDITEEDRRLLNGNVEKILSKAACGRKELLEQLRELIAALS